MHVTAWSSSSSKRDVRAALVKMENLAVLQPIRRVGNRDQDQDEEGAATNVNLTSGGSGSSNNNNSNNSGSGKNDEIHPQCMISLTKEYYRAIKDALSSLSPSPYKAITVTDYEQLVAKEKELELENNNNNNKSIGNDQGYKNNKPSRYPNKIPTPTELETYTQTRWDSVLHYLVGTDDSNYENPPLPVIHFLQQTGLMQEDPDWKPSGSSSGRDRDNINRDSRQEQQQQQLAPLVITSRGYEFMLQEVHVQVWQFILKHIQQCLRNHNGQELRREAMLFLICLSYCKVGRGYRITELSKPTRSFVKDFAYFGLLYVCKIGKSTIFFPTRVAVNLVVGGLTDASASSTSSSISAIPSGSGSAMSSTSELSALSTSAAATRALEVELEAATPSKNHIALIVQTNFQVAAYTTSSLHMAMLGLFCDVNTLRRLPNVIFFRITRDSVKSAFKLGIKAGQILRWMKMHAHPRLRTGDQPLIPSNVEDQIILWDRERTRVVMNEVYVLQCNGQKEYDAVSQYARDHEAYGWGCNKRRKLLIHYDKSELVVGYTRRWRARAAKRQEAIDSGVMY